MTGAEEESPEARALGCPAAGWRRHLFIIIFESDTRAGRAFDLVLLIVIIASVAVVMLGSMTEITAEYGAFFNALEWLFTLIFTLEYFARLACVDRPARYARSFFGMVDLLAVLPAYLAMLLPGLHSLIDVRALRLLRIFRILKLTAYIREYRVLALALRASGRKILLFITTVCLITVLLGTVMYVVEGPEHGFTSIPISIYWAITTITTVGFGDIAPQTDLGRAIASFMMLLGWGILAVPTGIVTAELAAERLAGQQSQAASSPPPTEGRRCASCGTGNHRESARFCQDCGAALAP